MSADLDRLGAQVIVFAQSLDEIVKDDSLPISLRVAAMKAGGGLTDLTRYLRDELEKRR